MTTTAPHTREATRALLPHDPDRLEVTPRRAAIIAGTSYVVLFAVAIFANFFMREGLIVSGDAEATATNIAESETLFRSGLIGFLAIFLLDVIIAWALYIVFQSASRTLSQLAAWFRLVYTVLLGVAIVFFFQALQLLDDTDALASFDQSQLQAQALVSLETFNSAWLIGLAAFGVHLIVLGSLIVANRMAPRALGLLLITAGGAYILDTVLHGLLNDYAEYETLLTTIVAVPSVIAEGWFGLWLLLRAGRDRPRP